MRARLNLRPEAAESLHGLAAPPPFVRVLKGHSGAEVVLHSGAGTSLVRKTAGTPAQNERLLRQSVRQRELLACGLRLPRVLREGLDEHGRAFFEMEYVPARSLAAILCDAAPFDAASVEMALGRMLGLFQMTEDGALPARPFHDKLDQIAAAVPQASALAARLRAMDWEGIPSSRGHDDLTLENILVCPSHGLVFIDCDEAFVSSWWLDVAKLCQDAMGHWCMRALYLNRPGSVAWLNARQRLDRMAQMLGAMAARLDPRLPARLAQLTALHLLRTLPYARDAALTAFVLARAAHVLKESP